MAIVKRKMKWKSVDEAPLEEIKEIFRSAGRKLTDEELNDIALEGEFP